MKNIFFLVLSFLSLVISGQSQIPLPDTVRVYSEQVNGAELKEEYFKTYDDQGQLLINVYRRINILGELFLQLKNSYEYNDNGDYTLVLRERLDAVGNIIDTAYLDNFIYNEQFTLLKKISIYELRKSHANYYLNVQGCHSAQEYIEFEVNPINGESIPRVAEITNWERDSDCNIISENNVNFITGVSLRMINEYDESKFLAKSSQYYSSAPGDDFDSYSTETFKNDILGRVTESVYLFELENISQGTRNRYTYEGRNPEYLTYRKELRNSLGGNWRVDRENEYFFDPHGKRILGKANYYYNDLSLVLEIERRNTYDDKGFLILLNVQASYIQSERLRRFEETESTYANRCDGAIITEREETLFDWMAFDPQTNTEWNPVILRYGYRKDVDCDQIEIPDFEFTISPNPARDFIYINSDLMNLSDTRLLIYDTKGAFIREATFHDRHNNFYALPNLENGIYFLRLENKSIDIKLGRQLIILK